MRSLKGFKRKNLYITPTMTDKEKNKLKYEQHRLKDKAYR